MEQTATQTQQTHGGKYIFMRIAAGFMAVLMAGMTYLSIIAQVKLTESSYRATSLEDIAQYVIDNHEYLTKDTGGRMIDALRNLLGGEPDTYEEYILAASIAIADEDYTTAVDYLQRCIDDTTDDTLRSELYLKEACLYALLGNNASAEICFNETIRLTPLNDEAYLLRAQVRMQAGQYGSALDDLMYYRQRRGDSVSLSAVLAPLYENMQRYDEAVEQYTYLLETGGSDYTRQQLLSSRAGCYLMNGQYDEAIADCEAGMKEEGDGTVHLQAMAGVALLSVGRFQEAVDAFHEAIAGGYEDPVLLYTQSIPCSYTLGDSETVIADGEKALALGCSDASVMGLLAAAYFDAERYADAKTAFDKYLSQDDSLENAYFYRGVCSMVAEDFTAAYSDFSSSIARGESVQSSYYNRGLCGLQTQRLDGAVADLKKASQMGDDTAVAGDANAMLKEIEAAVKQAQQTPEQ